MSTASRLVPVRIAVLRGDRDRWLEQAVSDWMQPTRASMPMIGTCWSDGDVAVRHGEEIDPLHAACGSEPTLGESLAVDLIARFGAALDDLAGVGPLAAGLVRRLAGGRFIDAPTRLVGWLSAHDCGAMLPTTLRQRMVDAWHRSVALWHRAARRLPSGGVAGVDMVERIADWLERATGGDGQPPRPRFDTIPGSGGPLFGEAATTVLLGHPAADPTASAVWRRQVVCLGPGALQTGVHPDDHLHAPAAVLVRPGREERQIEWLPLDTVAATVGWQDDDHLVRGVWLSAVPHGVAGIVDAA